MMPEMSGYQVLQKLKADPVTALIPVLFISAIETQESQEYGFSLGAVDYIIKPFNPNLVRARVEAHLRINHLYVDILRENSILTGKIAQLESEECNDKSSLFQELFSHTHDGVALTDMRGTIQAVNDAFTEITGYSIDEVYEQNFNLLKSNLHDDLFYEAMWQELVQKDLWSSEIYSKRKNGEVYQSLLSVSTIKNKQGDVIYYLAVFCDISHLKQAKDQLKELTFYDKLTSLPNRTLFIERLSQLIQTLKSLNQYAGALTLDIDNFREINVLKDITVGDSIITAIAKKLTAIT
ncbi:MAG: PAS domain S-box protein, partial [Sulfuricurvum sp.]